MFRLVWAGPGIPHMSSSDIAEEVARRRSRRDAKRRAAQDLKATRARLAAGTSIKPEFEYELLTMFVKNELGAAVTMPALYALFAIASMFWAPAFDAVVWLGIVIGAKVVLLDQGRRFLALPPGQVNVRMWRRRFIIVELLNGVALAGFALMGLGKNVGVGTDLAFSSHVFVFATLIVVLAIRTMFAASIPAILYAGTIPMTVAVVIRLLLLNDPVLSCAGLHGRRHPRLFPLFGPRPPLHRAVDARIPQREGRAHCRARGGEIGFRRGAAARRSRQQRQVALPRHHEPRAAHAAQCHPRLLRGDEDRAVRPDRKSDLPRLRGQHPRQRPPPPATHQRDPRPHAHRGRPLRAARGAGAARRCRIRVPQAPEAPRRRQRPAGGGGIRARPPRGLGRSARHAPDLPQPHVERAEVYAQRRPHHRSSSARPRTAASS